jgi:mRNA-degrading endonuclease RelE of RelBE toxin-antitoxin system
VTAPPERTVRAVPRFLKSKRRLPPAVQVDIDNQMQALLTNPLAGEPKAGALKGVRVVKFKARDRQYLLAYSFFPQRNAIEIRDVGVHENFYRDLQNYLKDR